MIYDSTLFKDVPGLCKWWNCERSDQRSGYCSAHYQRAAAEKSVEQMNAPIRWRGVCTECTAEDCSRPHGGDGLCDSHLRLLRRGMDRADVLVYRFKEIKPRVTPRRSPARDRATAYALAVADSEVMASVRAQYMSSDGGCVLWPHRRDNVGYGLVGAYGHTLHVHVLELMSSTGLDIRPPGMHASHKCHDEALARGECSAGVCDHRICVNVADGHVIWESARDNILAGGGLAAENAKAVTCKYGHPLDGLSSAGKRYCKECERDRWKR